MNLDVKVESPSKITRKLIITVPAAEVTARYERGLAEAQKTANLKGFRPGNAPIAMVQKVYGDDVRHRVFHQVIDESYKSALLKYEIRAVGRPQIDSSKHQHGDGEHDHGIKEGEDLTYTATVEILPEIEVKGYTGISLTKAVAEVTEADVEALLNQIRESQGKLVPASSGLVAADGGSSSRPVRRGDFVDLKFSGGLVTESGIEPQEGMTGSQTVEIGSNSLIPGFEEQVEGLRSGESKTFRITFPADYHEASLQSKEAEFSINVGDVKEKKLPELDDEMAKQMGFETLTELRARAKESMTRDRERDADRKMRSDLFQALIDKNKFECPQALIESQTRALAQDLAQELKQNRMDDATIQRAIMQEIETLKTRAENQVRSSLILEAIAKKENISVSDDEITKELDQMAAAMNVDRPKLDEYYLKDEARKEDLVFRIRQEKAVQFLFGAAKIK